VGLLNILVNSVGRLEVRMFPKNLRPLQLTVTGGRESTVVEHSELLFPTSSPIKICLPLTPHPFFSRRCLP